MKTFGSKMVNAVNVSNKRWQEIGMTTILTAIGAGLTYLAGHIGEIDMQKLGQWGPLVMTVAVPAISYLKNKIQELLKNNPNPTPEPEAPKPQPIPEPPFHRELDFNMIKNNKPG